MAATAVAFLPRSVALAEEPRACSLQASGHAQGDEWLSCLRVSAELDSLPATGEQATLGFEVTAQAEYSRLTVEAQLPSNLDWVSVPAGFEPRDSHLAIGTISLAPDETRRFAGTVRAGAPGGAHISVRAVAPPETDPEDGSVLSQDVADDHQFLTVAEAGGRSTPGIEGRPEGDAAPSASTTEPTLATPWLEHNPVPAPEQQPQQQKQQAIIMAPGDVSCVKGSFGYLDVVNKLSPNITVEVWDEDFLDANDKLATGLTDGLGAYHLCFPADDPDGPVVSFSQDVFVKFITSNAKWRVQDTTTGLPFAWVGPTTYNLAAFATHDFGYLQPGDPKFHLGTQAYDAVNDFWNWKPGACWDANDTAANCKQIVVNWRWDSMGGNKYDSNLNQVFLRWDAPKARKVVVHEATHATVDDVYEGIPIPGAGGPHDLTLTSNVGLAWDEGFAEWAPAAVYKSPSFDWANGDTENLETPTWGTAGWSTGDATEARVAGALIDLSDPANEKPWDRLNEGWAPGNIWKTFLGPAIGPPRVQFSFQDFWNHRTADGYNVAATGGLASVYQNTVDYKFRDPLTAYTPQLRPHPFVPHNFSFDATTSYWSVVAVKPITAGVDHDLKLFEDANLAVSLGSSQAFGSTVDFLAIDSNKKMLTDYFPQVYQASLTGSCRVELAHGSLSLAANSSQSVSMSSSSVAAVRDTFLSSGTTVTIKVTPTVATQDPELFLMRSTSGLPATYIRSRAQAFKTAAAAGPGLVETFTFVVPTTDWYGVVIINKAGSGSYTLQRIG